MPLPSRLRSGLSKVEDLTTRVRVLRPGVPAGLRSSPAVARAREVLGVVKPVGWLAVVLGLLLVVAGRLLHWREVVVLGTAGLLLVLLCLPWLVGRTRVRVDLELDPQRVVAGQSVVAALKVTNVGGSRLRSVRLDLPVGEGVYRYDLPGLAAGATHEEDFTIRTERRGVIPVGPATIRRGDPLGVASRDLTWAGVTEVLVRPPMVALDSLGAGLLRDLEGVSTDAISQSDLAFHALREYVPGDDLRHVHWRSSAKAAGSGAVGGSNLLVRQYLDTRRSHATIVVDDDADAWRDAGADGDFETAMSVVASIVVRAILDEFETSVVVGPQVSSGGDGNRALDTLCRAGLGQGTPDRSGLVAGARSAARAAPDTSLLFLLGGVGTDFTTFQRAAASFGPEVRRLAIRVDPTDRSRVTDAGNLPVLHLASRDDLAALLQWSVG